MTLLAVEELRRGDVTLHPRSINFPRRMVERVDRYTDEAAPDLTVVVIRWMSSPPMSSIPLPLGTKVEIE